MKTALLSLLAAASLLASTASAAPATARHGGTANVVQNPHDRLNDRNDKDFNYGFDKKHRVTPEELKRWEEAHRTDRKDDKHDGRKDDHKDDKHDNRKNDKHDDRNDKDFNYGFDKKHKVTPEERTRWEAAHRNDGRR